MAQQAIDDETVRDVLDGALPGDWELAAVDGPRAVLVHSGCNRMADTSEPDRLMRASGYRQRYVYAAEGRVRLLYEEEP
jgi:hypothetical protein